MVMIFIFDCVTLQTSHVLGAVEPVERGGLVINGSLVSIPRADRHREAFRSTVMLKSECRS